MRGKKGKTPKRELTTTERIVLAKNWVEKAERSLKATQELVQNPVDSYDSVANRSYYTVFQAVSSLLALDGGEFDSHKAVTGLFQKNYVKTGIFAPEYSDILKTAFDFRQTADYNARLKVSISKEDADELVRNAEYFLDGIKNYVQSAEKSIFLPKNVTTITSDTFFDFKIDEAVIFKFNDNSPAITGLFKGVESRKLPDGSFQIGILLCPLNGHMTQFFDMAKGYPEHVENQHRPKIYKLPHRLT